MRGQSALLAPVLKAAAVGLLTQLTESFCKDAGQQALAKAVELGGGVLALYAPAAAGEQRGGSYCSGWREADDAEVPDISAAGGSACNRRMRSGGCFAGGGRDPRRGQAGGRPFAEAEEALDGISPLEQGSFTEGFKQVLSGAVKGLGGWMRQGAQVSAALLARGAAVRVRCGGEGRAGAAVRMAGCLGIAAVCTSGLYGMIALAQETLDGLGSFSALLLPVLSSALTASGGGNKRRNTLRWGDAAHQRADEPDPLVPHSVRLLLFLSGRGAVCHRGRPAGMSARAGRVDGKDGAACGGGRVYGVSDADGPARRGRRMR